MKKIPKFLNLFFLVLIINGCFTKQITNMSKEHDLLINLNSNNTYMHLNDVNLYGGTISKESNHVNLNFQSVMGGTLNTKRKYYHGDTSKGRWTVKCGEEVIKLSVQEIYEWDSKMENNRKVYIAPAFCKNSTSDTSNRPDISKELDLLIDLNSNNSKLELSDVNYIFNHIYEGTVSEKNDHINLRESKKRSEKTIKEVNGDIDITKRRWFINCYKEEVKWFLEPYREEVRWLSIQEIYEWDSKMENGRKVYIAPALFENLTGPSDRSGSVLVSTGSKKHDLLIDLNSNNPYSQIDDVKLIKGTISKESAYINLKFESIPVAHKIFNGKIVDDEIHMLYPKVGRWSIECGEEVTKLSIQEIYEWDSKMEDGRKVYISPALCENSNRNPVKYRKEILLSNSKDSTIILRSERASMVQNGAAYDVATIEISDAITNIILPKSAKIIEGGKEEKLSIRIKRVIGFMGHPPDEVSPRIARKYMGCAYKFEGNELVLATYGEWSSIEGGAYIELEIELPKKLKLEKREDLSGYNSIAAGYSRRPKNMEGHWYGSNKPKEGWIKIDSYPDVNHLGW